MATNAHSGPVLFCYDGSEGSRSAMQSVAALIAAPVDAVVLTIWERIYVMGVLPPPSEGDFDEREEALARGAAEEGARQATEHGYRAKPLVREAPEGIAHEILEVANELSARLIVCGQRGRGPLKAALLGSVSHALASHTARPILIAPEATPPIQ